MKGKSRTDLGDVGAQDLARIFRLTARRVRQLTEEGMPRSSRGRYPIEACLQWYIARLEQQLAEKPAGPEAKDYDRARTRRTSAQARQAELQVAVLEGTLMPVTLHVERLTGLVDKWAGVLKSIVGRWPSSFPEVPARQAQLRFRALVNQLLTELEAGRTVNERNGSHPRARRNRKARR